jgi:hypothetical protein
MSQGPILRPLPERPTSYLGELAQVAAALIRSRKSQPTPQPIQTKRRRGAPVLTVEERKQLAFAAFPNHFGDYLGKRDAKPQPKPLAPDQRFARLKATYLTFARDRWIAAQLAVRQALAA